MPIHSPWIQAGVDWLRGDDAIMYKAVPEEVGKKHVTELLHQHPFHPFDPKIHGDKTHPCYTENLVFYQCMASMEEGMKLHMKHVNCYHPYKTDLMKCLVKFRKAQRLLAENSSSGADEAAEAKK